MQFISKRKSELTTKVHHLLRRGSQLLGKVDSDKKDRNLIDVAIKQLDELFLLVVAGEYNSGKSAFINALLGGEYLQTGITPTTDRVNVIEYGKDVRADSIETGIKKISVPVDFLKETRIVDTPGTNAVLREHEILTKEYIPRSDIVLFVTSIDRPFTESERAFLEHTRQWGKKIVLIINKIDLVEDKADIEKVIKFVDDNAYLLLGHHPPIFTISSKIALRQVLSGNSNHLLGKIEGYIFKTLNESERLRIKLSNPLNILNELINKYHKILNIDNEAINRDKKLLEDINNQLDLFKEDALRRFKFRYADLDNIILEFQQRGIDFFDETFRIARLFDLANNERIQREYKEKVIKNLSRNIDEKVNDLIEWMVEENYNQWHTINEKINARMTSLSTRITTRSTQQSLQVERKKIIADIRRESQRVIEKYDRNLEAKQIGNAAQMSVAASAAIEVGAIGLGTLVTILATTASADLTGILLAGLTATLGFFIIPTKKNQAKRGFIEKTNQLRNQLRESLSVETYRQLDIVVDNINHAIEPFDRFVKSEIERFADISKDMDDIQNGISVTKDKISNIN